MELDALRCGQQLDRNDILYVVEHVVQSTCREVLENLALLWRRPVRLETRRGSKPIRLGYDGTNTSEEALIEPAAEQEA